MEAENDVSLQVADVEDEPSSPETGPERPDPTVEIEQPVALAEAKGLGRNGFAAQSERIWNLRS